MTSTERGRGEAATAISFPSASEQMWSAQPSSPSLTPQMAISNVDTSYSDPLNRSQFNENIPSMIMNTGLPFSPGLDHGLMSQEDSNYQICQPQTQSYSNNDHNLSEMSCTPSDLSHSPQSPMFWPNGGNDKTRPRSCPDVDFFSSMNNMPGSQTYDYVSMYQVQPHITHTPLDLSIGPTSEPFARTQEDGFDQPMQHSDILESIEPCRPSHRYSSHLQFREDESMKHQSTTPFDEDVDTTCDDMDVDKSQPYAKSLYRCLKEAPDHTMILRDIYDWFRANTDKGQDPHERGWQNSIRHNLSMNKAFEKIEVQSSDDPTKKGFQWRLSQKALKAGKVESTTRYRNKQPKVRGNNKHPAPNRQGPGRLGGEMAKRSALVRRSERLQGLRSELAETGNLLRNQGVIRSNHMRALRSQFGDAVPGSPPRYAGLDYFSSDPGSASQSGPSSPYFLPDDNTVFSASPAHYNLEPSMNMLSRTPAFGGDSYQSSPELGQPEFHFLPIGDRVFYDSNTPESVSEPRTPMSDAGMDVQMGSVQFSTPFFTGEDLNF